MASADLSSELQANVPTHSFDASTWKNQSMSHFARQRWRPLLSFHTCVSSTFPHLGKTGNAGGSLGTPPHPAPACSHSLHLCPPLSKLCRSHSLSKALQWLPHEASSLFLLLHLSAGRNSHWELLSMTIRPWSLPV